MEDGEQPRNGLMNAVMNRTAPSTRTLSCPTRTHTVLTPLLALLVDILIALTDVQSGSLL